MIEAFKLPNGVRYKTKDVQTWEFYKVENEKNPPFYEFGLHFYEDSEINPFIMQFDADHLKEALSFVATVDNAHGLRTSEIEELEKLATIQESDLSESW